MSKTCGKIVKKKFQKNCKQIGEKNVKNLWKNCEKKISVKL